jgi:hypothetical protein
MMHRAAAILVVASVLLPSTGASLQTAEDTLPARVVDRAVHAFIRHDADAFIAQFDSVYYFQDLEPGRVSATQPGAPRRMRAEQVARSLREAWERPDPDGRGHVDTIARLVAGRFVVHHLALWWESPEGEAQRFEKLEIYEVCGGKIIAEYDGQYVAGGPPESTGAPSLRPAVPDTARR